MSKITIEHEGKRYEVEDFTIHATRNGNALVKFDTGLCPECGNNVFWIQAYPAKPVMRDGSVPPTR